jgi:sigma-B regulation protein RsbU (phosphoserine phosphatase)
MNTLVEAAKAASRTHAVKVMLIDDQRMVGEAVRRMLLELPGAEFRFCSNPETAVETAIQFKPTVILQDLIMPDVDGLDMVRRFREVPETATVPLIVLSSKEEASTKADAFTAGANDYLVKLPDKLELLARIAYHSAAYILRLERDEAFQALHDQKELISQELTEAKNYVRSLLPPPIEPGEYLASDWRFIPSTALGGDAFGYHWLDERRMAIYLLDVCGHGVGAALMSVSAMNVIRSRTLPDTDFAAPEQVLKGLNQAFPMSRHGGKYFSIWYGVYDAEARTLTYASGGHPPALLVPVEGEAKQMSSTGLIVGVFSSAEFEAVTLVVEPDSVLYLFSDGCYEVPLPDGDTMEAPPFLRMLESCALNMGSLDSVVREIQNVQGKLEFDDDFSLVEFRFF